MWGQVYGDRKAKEVELNKQGECLNNNMEVQIKDNKIYAPLKDKFEKEWLQNFKPVLNKLLDVFNLN
jgi:hypothetical protein